jgi:integrase/recombinase XerD
MQEMLEEFLLFISSERGMAKNTIAAYKGDLLQFFEFLATQKLTLSQVSEQKITLYISSIYKKKLSIATTNRKLACLKSFFKFLYANGFIASNSCANLELIKKQRSLPVFLSKEEILLITLQASKDNTPKGVRVYAILEILYSTGMRISECLSICMDEIVLDTNELVINGKGGKQRSVFLNDSAKLAINKYLSVRANFTSLLSAKNIKNNKYLFCAEGSLGYYSRQNFFIALKKLAHKCKINQQKLSPHKIRHSFATHIYQGGANLRVLQQMLGHSDISTTQIYTHTDVMGLKTAVKSFHPLAKKISR